MQGFLTLLCLLPLLLPAGLILVGVLTGRIAAGGLWEDSFKPGELSPARVYQFIASVSAAAAVLIGLAETGGTAFAPFPDWLFAAAGGGNLVYLGAKFASARRARR